MMCLELQILLFLLEIHQHHHHHQNELLHHLHQQQLTNQLKLRQLVVSMFVNLKILVSQYKMLQEQDQVQHHHRQYLARSYV
jgi:hypothetical protein